MFYNNQWFGRLAWFFLEFLTFLNIIQDISFDDVVTVGFREATDSSYTGGIYQPLKWAVRLPKAWGPLAG